MKKYAFLTICIAAFMSGCAESDSNSVNNTVCGYGHFDGTTCVCDAGYYKTTEEGSCINKQDTSKDPNDPNSNPTAEKCYATIYYTNPGTSASSGGTKDWDVYLIGDFNNWKKADASFKMNALGDGTHAIKLAVTKNQSIEYKFYVDGWADASYQTTEADGKSNIKTTFASCDMSIGDANGKKYEGDSTASIASENTPVQPGPATEKCQTTFKFSNEWLDKNGDGSAANWQVYLVGSFNVDSNNEWVKTDPKYLMQGDGNGKRTITVELPQNSCYEYKYYIDGWGGDSWHTDGANNANGVANITSCGKTYGNGVTDSGSCSNSSGNNNNPSTPVASASNCWLESEPSVSGKTISFEIQCKDGSSSISNVSGGISPQINGMKVTDTVPENSKYSYTVTVDDSEVFVPVWVEDNKFDWKDAVLYFAFTDRFMDGDSSNNNPATDASDQGSSSARWKGGDFKGLQTKVDEGYFTNLGVNTLWISSVSMNAQGISWGTNGDTHSYSAYHSYWPVSSFMTDTNMSEFTSNSSNGVQIQAIEPHFGTMDDLKNLVDACHKKGIRVLIDFAANQVHKDSPVYINHRNWFNDVDNPVICDDNNGWGWNNYSEKCWFSADLPDIDYGNAEARKAMIDHVEWLVKKTNVDGFRVDAVKHMNVQFIKDMRAKTDQLYSNSGSMFYMVGETFDGNRGNLNNFIGDDMLHAQFDFALYYALQGNVIACKDENGSKNCEYADFGSVKAALEESKNTYKSDLMGTFMGNHDVARALSVAANQYQDKWGSNEEVNESSWGVDNWWIPYFKVKAAWTILLTNPGVPLIYYGDEYGQEGSNDPDNRRMMKFDNFNAQQSEMLSFVQKLGKIRSEHKAITRGWREDLDTQAKHWCYKVTNGNESIIVALAASNGNGEKCNLNGNYKLQNLLNPEAPEFETGEITFGDDNKLSVYLVK